MADGRSQWEREQRRRGREIEQKQRAQERAQIAAEKKTTQLAHTFEELEGILRTGLQRPGRLDVTSLYYKPHAPELKLGALASPVPEPEFVAPLAPGIVSRLLGGQKRYQQDLEVAQQRHQEQLAAAQHQERERQRQVAAKQREHEATVRRVQAESQRHNDALAAIGLGVAARDKESVENTLSGCCMPLTCRGHSQSDNRTGGSAV